MYQFNPLDKTSALPKTPARQCGISFALLINFVDGIKLLVFKNDSVGISERNMLSNLWEVACLPKE